MKNFLFCVALMLMCGMAAAQAPAAENPLAAARAFPFEQMTVTKNPNGGEVRRVVTGTLATGEVVGVHETTQPVGAVPSALHVIQHSEMIVMVEGTVEYHHENQVDRVGPGGVIYVALGTHHFVKNVGDVPAKYVVVAIGGDVKK